MSGNEPDYEIVSRGSTSLTDEALAHRLDMIANDVRVFMPYERKVYLEEAAERLRNPNIVLHTHQEGGSS